MIKFVKDWLWLPAIVLIIISVIFGFQNSQSDIQSHYGFYSLFPAIVTLFLCFYTKNVILALFTGIVVGGLISSQYNILNALVHELSVEDNTALA